MGENDMILRVAATLVRAECKRRFDWEPSDGELAPMIPAYMKTAYAIVRCMREPTERMTRSFLGRLGAQEYGDVQAAAVWREMIDTVLAA